MRTLAEWLALQESVHPKSIDLGLARVAAVARTLGVAEPAFAVHHRRRHQRQGLGGRAPRGAAARRAACAPGCSPRRISSATTSASASTAREVDDAALVAAFERIEAARGATTLTFFEYNTLAALLIFARRTPWRWRCSRSASAGASMPPTSSMPTSRVLASIGFDHRDWLGDTLEQIGAEKAGIFRAGRPAVLGTPDDARAACSPRSDAWSAQAVVAERDFSWRSARCALGLRRPAA